MARFTLAMAVQKIAELERTNHLQQRILNLELLDQCQHKFTEGSYTVRLYNMDGPQGGLVAHDLSISGVENRVYHRVRRIGLDAMGTGVTY